MPARETLSNSALMKEIRNLVRRGNAVEVRLIEHLSEFLQRELHLAFGVRSAFAYLTGELGFSRDVALKRLRAARAVRIRPEALEQLALGRLSVSSLAALGSAIEIPELYEYSLGRSKREVELSVALLTKKRSPRGNGSRVAIETPDGNVAVLYRMPPEVAAKIATAAALFEETARGRAEASFSDTLNASMDLVIESLEAELEKSPPGPAGARCVLDEKGHTSSSASANSNAPSDARGVDETVPTDALDSSAQSVEEQRKIASEPRGKRERRLSTESGVPTEASARRSRAERETASSKGAKQISTRLAVDRQSLIVATTRWGASLVAAAAAAAMRWRPSRAPP